MPLLCIESCIHYLQPTYHVKQVQFVYPISVSRVLQRYLVLGSILLHNVGNQSKSRTRAVEAGGGRNERMNSPNIPRKTKKERKIKEKKGNQEK